MLIRSAKSATHAGKADAQMFVHRSGGKGQPETLAPILFFVFAVAGLVLAAERIRSFGQKYSRHIAPKLLQG